MAPNVNFPRLSDSGLAPSPQIMSYSPSPSHSTSVGSGGYAPENSETGRKRSSSLLGGVGNEDYKRIKSTTNGLTGGSRSAEGTYKLKRSTKATGPRDNEGHLITDDPLKLERHKTILKSIFANDPATTAAGVPDLSTTFPVGIDPDTSIDDHDHTALHWAAALARISVVRALINFGADMHRGNNVGETPLIRAVLVTNNSDNDAFPRLLEVLGPSLRTVDDTGRTILHHAALVAGVKGRASSARYYMESVLEFIARHEKGQFKDLVDVQDANGDTALNIAARVGNRGLVRMLIEVEADKTKPNKLGLRPGDFGVEGVDLTVKPAEDVISSLRAPVPSPPAQKSSEILSSITTILSTLNTDFSAELKLKTDALDRTRLQLRTATKELSEQRKQITLWKSKAAEVVDVNQRIKNLERALVEEDSFDWTGRTEIDGSPANAEIAGAGFTYRGPSSTLSNLPVGIAIEFDADPPPPTTDSDPHSLVHLLKLDSWYGRVTSLLTRRIEKLQGGNAEQERRLRDVVAGCCGVEVGTVTETWLEDILASVESDGNNLDMARVASFLARVALERCL